MLCIYVVDRWSDVSISVHINSMNSPNLIPSCTGEMLRNMSLFSASPAASACSVITTPATDRVYVRFQATSAVLAGMYMRYQTTATCDGTLY